MKGAVESGVTDIWRHRARKWEKATKDKGSTLLPSVCVCGWVFFSLYVSLRRGRTWTPAKSQYPCRSPQDHTHSHPHTHTTRILAQSTAATAAWMSAGGETERGSRSAREGRRNLWSYYLLLLVFCVDWGWFSFCFPCGSGTLSEVSASIPLFFSPFYVLSPATNSVRGKEGGGLWVTDFVSFSVGLLSWWNGGGGLGGRRCGGKLFTCQGGNIIMLICQRKKQREAEKQTIFSGRND